jgi:recombinational DNA repair ATPase RecF
MSPEIQAQVIDRLIASGKSDEPWALIVLAAMESAEQLDGFLDKKTSVAPPQKLDVADGVATEPPGAYVSSIAVEGFRGIGPATTLNLRPGPGLTLVVGRNGSGKSSFAEGLEYLLTGRNYRWEKRPKVWLEGWRNLHHDRTALKSELLVEGLGSVAVSRTWKSNDFASSEVACVGPGKKSASLEALGWSDALVTFRPFLSYNELGSLLEEGPSKLYDALSKVLGLEELVAVQAVLADARKARQEILDTASEGADAIKSLLDATDEGAGHDRIAAAQKALKTSAWDLSALKKLTHNAETRDASQVEMLRRLESIEAIDDKGVARSVETLRASARSLADLAGTDAERSRQRANILQQALTFHETHKEKDCPVCGTKGVLLATWVKNAQKEIKTLRQEAAACDAADAAVKTGIREAQRYLGAAPPFLAQAKDAGVAQLADLRRLWLEWSTGRDIDDPTALAAHMQTRVLGMNEAIRNVAENAALERGRLEDLWRPIASAIAEWLPIARKALDAKDTIKQIKAAEDWWKETSAGVRDERFTPIASRARNVWSQLRLQSNVDLGGVILEGTAGRRRVALQVTVDGTPAEALGVMSQGELHSLALSLFLPRATLPESPFRFICIDDPVQSMDPARVEGLARVLADAAVTRLVIVFTHDDRLPEAVRRLGLAATVHSVTRRSNSLVDVRQTTDPVTTLIEDARAVALTDDLPDDVAGRVVPGFCRAAVEAACMECIRRRRLGRGEPHDTVESLLADNAKIHPLLALALFDEASRSNDVMPRLQRLGPWAVEAFKICKMGAHERVDGDLKTLIDSSQRLAKQLLELK